MSFNPNFTPYVPPTAGGNPLAPSSGVGYQPSTSAQSTAPAAGQANQAQAALPYLHPAVQAAATTPGASLSPSAIQQLQSQHLNFGPLAAQPQSQSSQGLTTQQGLQNIISQSQKGETKAQSQQAAQQQQATLNQLNALVDPNKLTSSQVSGPQADATAQQIAKLLSGMSYSQAQSFLKKLPANTTLSSLVTQYMSTGGQPQQAAKQAPTYDPLALQTMWHDVFGPAFNQVAKITGSTGQDYLAGMNQAIAGSNLPANERQQLTGQSQATAALLQQVGGQALKSVATQPTYDSMIAALQAAAGAAQQYQGEAEKVYGVQQAAATAPYYTGQGGASPAGAAPTNNININQLLKGAGVTP